MTTNTDKMTVKELRVVAKKMGIKKYYKMLKKDLVTTIKIQENQEQVQKQEQEQVKQVQEQAKQAQEHKEAQEKINQVQSENSDLKIENSELKIENSDLKIEIKKVMAESQAQVMSLKNQIQTMRKVQEQENQVKEVQQANQEQIQISSTTVGTGDNKVEVFQNRTEKKAFKTDAVRIPEFLTKINKISTVGISLNKASNWRTLREFLDNADDSNPLLIQEKKEDLVDLERNLKKGKVARLSRIEKACVDELSRLLTEHAISTVAKMDIPQYKKAIVAKYNEFHPSLAFFRMPTATRKQMNNQYSKTASARAGKKEFDFDNVDRYIEVAKELIKSDSYISIAAGLCALTGRRPSEVLLSAEFSQTQEREINFYGGDGEVLDSVEFPDMLGFKGQLKKKGDSDKDNYPIPVLCSPELIISGLNKLRTIKDLSHLKVPYTDKNGREWTPGQRVNNYTGNTLNARVRLEFQRFFGSDVKPYDLRHAYVLIIREKYVPKDEQIQKVSSEILGHNETDKDTWISYLTLTTKKGE